MPVIDLTLGAVPAATRKDLIINLTKTASETAGIPADHFVVFVHELADDCIGVGGRPLDLLKQQTG